MVSTEEWLRMHKRMNDSTILRKLIAETYQVDLVNLPLNIGLFEKTYGFGTVPKQAVSDESIERALGSTQEMVDLQIAMSKRNPKGDTLREQIESLLPNNVINDRESIIYTLSRIVTQRIPRKIRWPIIPEGLDTLTAALLHLYAISKAVDQRIPWIIAIWKTKILDAKIDALKKIENALLSECSREDLRDALESANEKYNQALSLNPRIDSQDPLSQQISNWIADIIIKDKELDELLPLLKRSVQERKEDIMEYSSSRKTQAHVQSDPITNWNLLALRPDGPSAHEHNTLLRILRQEFNILKYDPVWKLCLNLSQVEAPGHPTAEELSQVSDFSERNAYLEMYRLDSLFNEYYLLNLEKLGLRYRYIFTETQRSGVKSDGRIEKLRFIEEKPRSCTIHVEPTWSQEPDLRLLTGVYSEAVVDHEIVTLNLNHYDAKAGDWLSLMKDDLKKKEQRDEYIIQRKTRTTDRTPFSPTPRQMELLGFLWSLYGLRRQRNWLFDAVNYRQQTANRNLGVLLDNKVLRLLYLPALEFCKLPDGFVGYASCHDRKSRDKLVDHLIQSQPFSRIHLGDSNDIVALVRSPFKKSDVIAGDLREKMSEFSDNYFTARLQKRTSSTITVFHRLFDSTTKTWKDPWKL